ncbi:autophagy-related protein [Phanerochaete sordida]|uniref:Autophagy-related protein 101 n=1 Tax=Phanerochaete sordida TaxID=48140 RepID=A0A9P3LLE1_9APHY|nr:autophagy-related protein [Phanerochaete sordida]
MSSPNLPIVKIDLSLERRTARDVLTAVLHSILFHRLFGTLKPEIREVLDVSMPAVDDPEIKQLVDLKVDAFWKGVESDVNKRGQFIVTFSEKRSRKSWFLVSEEEVPWEQWVVNAEIRPPIPERERQKYDADLTATLKKSLQSMLTHTSSERGRSAVPLITNAQGISPFPVKIVVNVNGTEVSG